MGRWGRKKEAKENKRCGWEQSDEKIRQDAKRCTPIGTRVARGRRRTSERKSAGWHQAFSISHFVSNIIGFWSDLYSTCGPELWRWAAPFLNGPELVHCGFRSLRSVGFSHKEEIVAPQKHLLRAEHTPKRYYHRIKLLTRVSLHIDSKVLLLSSIF